MVFGHSIERSPARISSRSALVYEMAASSSLPSFDLSLCLKHKLLNEKHLKLYNRMMRPIQPVMLQVYMTGFVIRALAFFTPALIGKWLAPISFALQIPHTVNVILLFRYDFARILVQTFDFWFLGVSVVISCVCFVCAFQDNRVWVLPSCCLDFIDAFLIESLFGSPKRILVVTLSSVVFFFAVITALVCGQIDDLKNVTVISSQSHALTTRDLLLNSMGTIMMLLCRLAFTMYKALQRQHSSGPQLQSSGYLCRVKLELLGVLALQPTKPAVETKNAAKIYSMQLACKCREPIDSARTLLPWISNRKLHPLLIWTMNLVGVIGVVSTFTVLFPWSFWSAEGNWTVAYVALTCTFAFNAWFSCYRQRLLVRKLVSTFNFLFLSFQISTAYVSACDVIYWDKVSCCGLLSSWLWTHWVLLSDTICPISRTKLRFRLTRLPVTLLFSVVVAHMTVICEVLTENRWQLQDRTIVKYAIGDSLVEFRVVPFLLSRQITILVWSTRMLWGVWKQREPDELLLLQGQVEYDAPINIMPTRSAVVNTDPVRS